LYGIVFRFLLNRSVIQKIYNSERFLGIGKLEEIFYIWYD